jgi:hypothetical protein
MLSFAYALIEIARRRTNFATNASKTTFTTRRFRRSRIGASVIAIHELTDDQRIFAAQTGCEDASSTGRWRMATVGK